jgi:hypothetical protein
VRSAAAALVLTIAGTAWAGDPVELTAAVGGDEAGAERSVLVGSSGQLYYRADDALVWRREQVGGLAAKVSGALRVGRTIVAVGERTPVYRWGGQAWSARPLGNRGSTTVAGAGGKTAFAVGRHIYVRRGKRWIRMTSAPRQIVALWLGGGSRIYAADDKGGLRRRSGGVWRQVPTKLATDETIVQLAGTPGKELYARTSAGGVLQVRTSGATPLTLDPSVQGLRPTTIAPASEGGVWVVGEIDADAGSQWVLAHATGGSAKAVRPLPVPAAGDRYTIVRAGDDGSLLIASTRGRVLVRAASGSWSEGSVSGKLPPSATRTFPEAAPARAR